MRRPVFPVVLSGGTGSRLWPLSREAYPKQLIALVDEHTLLQATVLRLTTFEDLRSPIVVCNEEHRFMVAEQLQAIGVTPDAILLEPMARNTAPAIATAALEALSQCGEDDEPILLVMPTDHVIRDNEKFAGVIQEALQEAAVGRLVAFGATPDYAETGYGYIKAGPVTGVSKSARTVEAFVEKPDREKAATLIEDGDCYWNSGMFVFGARCYLEELERYAAPVREATQKAYANAKQDLGFLRLDAECFAKAPSLSVDYAVMEHTSDSVVVPFAAGWSDIGSWAALMDLFAPAQRNEAGNIIQGDAILEDTRDTYIRAESRIIATLGVTDLVIIDTPDALLVANRNATQNTRKIVEQLKRADREEYRCHRKVYRPWGHYERVDDGEGFQVKRLSIRPGGRLSLQMHRHRAEHWVVVRGTAKVTRGEETFLLSKNQSAYIPQGTRHRLENPTEEVLDLIEVQSGDYLGEDDIVRFEDIYGRAGSEASKVPEGDSEAKKPTPTPGPKEQAGAHLPVSVVIISANSAETIRRCLKSLAIFDEIIVYLNNCTDNTAELCADFENVRVVEGEFTGFGSTRNMAAEYAQHPWILAIGTDEWLDDELKQSIQRINFGDPGQAYKMRRPRVVLGQPVTVGGVERKPKIRLYHRETGQFDSKLVHEQVVLKDGTRPVLLAGKLWHEKESRDRAAWGIDSTAYGVSHATIFSGKKAFHPGVALLRAWATFFKSFVLQKGFLAGWRGILIAHHTAHGVFVKHSAHYVQTQADPERRSDPPENRVESSRVDEPSRKSNPPR